MDFLCSIYGYVQKFATANTVVIMHYNFQIGGKNFPNVKARIHLSGDPSLRNGMISTVCSSAPNEVKVQFINLVRAKRLEKEERFRKRKRRDELMKSHQLSSSPLKQTRLAVGIFFEFY